MTAATTCNGECVDRAHDPDSPVPLG
jgi:hypothetical protein